MHSPSASDPGDGSGDGEPIGCSSASRERATDGATTDLGETAGAAAPPAHRSARRSPPPPRAPRMVGAHVRELGVDDRHEPGLGPRLEAAKMGVACGDDVPCGRDPLRGGHLSRLIPTDLLDARAFEDRDAGARPQPSRARIEGQGGARRPCPSGTRRSVRSRPPRGPSRGHPDPQIRLANQHPTAIEPTPSPNAAPERENSRCSPVRSKAAPSSIGAKD